MCIEPKRVAARPYEVEVGRGIEYLNDRWTNWFNDIDLDTLDLGECTYCVIGQLLGDYVEYATAMCGVNPLWGTKLGFDRKRLRESISLKESEYEYKLLTQEWKRRILELREERNVNICERSSQPCGV